MTTSLPLVVPTRRFAFRGDSMLPLLEDGDEVFARPAPLEALSPGDLAVFARFQSAAPSFVVHRLTPSGRTRGDASRAEDAPLEPSAVFGAASSMRRGRRWADLSSGRGAAWSAFCSAYGRAVFSWWWSALPEESPFSAFAKAALLAPPRLVFRLLF